MDSNHGQRMCAGRLSLSSSFQPGCRQRHPAPGGICGLLQVKSLWALWFVDDGILCFRNMQQLQRLFPRLQQSLAHLGLQINMSKSKLLGWSLPAMLPTCVDGIQVVQQTVFLGVPVSISYDDSNSNAVQNLLRRSVQAFFSNRRLLTESTVSISLRMRMFDAVVTSTIRWALGTLLPSVSTLNALRVQCTTLLVWTLRLRQQQWCKKSWSASLPYRSWQHWLCEAAPISMCSWTTTRPGS